MAPRTMAAASGCSLCRSTDAATRSSRSGVTPGAGSRSASAGRPWVSVPVLSNTTVSMPWADSSTSAPRISTPSSAPRPVPTISAVGVASPSAHGQAMMSTATAASSACASRGAGPRSNHRTNAASATVMTTGTNTAAMRSARRATAALLPCACCTSRTICISTESAPTFSACMWKAPDWLTVAPTTASPGPTSTGMGSPVSMDWSMRERPSVTRPSTGTRSPGRTRSRSPGATASSGTASVSPPFTRWATRGRRSSRRRIAREVPARAWASSIRPSRIRTTITAAVSK